MIIAKSRYFVIEPKHLEVRLNIRKNWGLSGVFHFSR